MASRYCTKCGREVLEGKQFCGGCGQAMPVATVIATPQSVPVPASMPHTCSHCGAILTPGKRFCKQCGQPVVEPSSIAGATATTAEAAVAPPVCAQCGAVLVPGKRFCRQCGQATDSTVAPAQVKAGSTEQSESQARQPASPNLPSAEPIALPAAAQIPVSALGHASPVAELTAPADAPIDGAASTSDWTSNWGSQESASLLSSLPPAANAFPRSVKSEQESRLQPKMKLGLAIGIAAIVLMVAGGALLWHFHSRGGVSSAATAPSAPRQPQTASPNQIQNPTATAMTQQSPKPSAGIQEHPAPNPTESNSASDAKTPVSPPPTIPVAAPQQQAEVIKPQPAIAPATPSLPASAPATPHSGVLHYQGPPVPYNGAVVFDNLPKARLRFAFDHQAWSLTLKPNPDGTKKATLTSLAPGYQTSCDLSWETIE